MPSHILDAEFCRIHSTILTSHHQIVIYLVLWKRACKDTITPSDKARGTAERRAPVFAEEEEQILPPDKKSSCSKIEEDCRRRRCLH